MQAAWAKDMAAGLGTTLRAGTITCSAKVPWWRSLSSERSGSSVSSPRQSSVLITGCTTTSAPSSSTPAASQPRIMGKASARMPTPRRVHRSCRLTLAARTLTRTQPGGTTGSGRSPSTRAAIGSSGSGAAAYAANMTKT